MRYTLRQLEVFLTVARMGSVSRAGRELGLSQSATSSSLADLERQFELQLFDRMGKRLRLSARGAVLRAGAEAVLELARDLERAFESGAVEHRLRVGATLTIGN
jgi:DNA-binding transcriptional LysR family regulator